MKDLTPAILAVPRQLAANQNSVRQSNLALVTAELFSNGGGQSRADLAAGTGLTRATISRLVQDLLDLGVIAESSPSGNKVPGRPGTPLYPAQRTIVGIGLEVSIDHISGCAIDLTGIVIESFGMKIELIDSSPEGALAQLFTLTELMIAKLEKNGIKEICGICLGVPAVIDSATNSIVYAPNLGWKDVNPARIFHAQTGRNMPFSVDNDANLQALATSSYLPILDSFLYVSGDIGIGGAIIRERTLYQGTNGWAGEIGHTTIEPAGPPCRCGSRGCLERYAGQRAVVFSAGLSLDSTPADVITAIESGDTKAKKAVERAGWALGIAISNTVNLIDIDNVVLGTSLGHILPWLAPKIEKELDDRLLARSSADIRLYAAPLSDFPASRGGAIRCLQTKLQNPGLDWSPTH